MKEQNKKLYTYTLEECAEAFGIEPMNIDTIRYSYSRGVLEIEVIE